MPGGVLFLLNYYKYHNYCDSFISLLDLIGQDVAILLTVDQTNGLRSAKADRVMNSLMCCVHKLLELMSMSSHITVLSKDR